MKITGFVLGEVEITKKQYFRITNTTTIIKPMGIEMKISGSAERRKLLG